MMWRWPWQPQAFDRAFKTVADPLKLPDLMSDGTQGIRALLAGNWSDQSVEEVLTEFEQERMVNAWRKAKSFDDLEQARAEVRGARAVLNQILVVRGERYGPRN